MRGAQGVEQGDADPGGLGGVDRAVAEDAVGERAALDQLHDHVRTFVVLDDVVHDDDVRVPQLGDRAGLAQGALTAPPGLGRGEGLVEGSAFTATSRASSWSVARHTMPMPPRPSRSWSR